MVSTSQESKKRRLLELFWPWLRTDTVWLLLQYNSQNKVQGQPRFKMGNANFFSWWVGQHVRIGIQNHWWWSLQTLSFPFSVSLFSFTSVSRDQIPITKRNRGKWDRGKPESEHSMSKRIKWWATGFGLHEEENVKGVQKEASRHLGPDDIYDIKELDVLSLAGRKAWEERIPWL